MSQKRSPQKSYRAALRAILSRHKTASYRDAQGIYRLLRRTTAAPISAKQIRTARPSTTSKLLSRARALGSRTTPRTAKERAKQAKLAKKFNPENRRKEPKKRHAKKTSEKRPTKIGGSGRARRGDDEGGADGPEAPTRDTGAAHDEEIDDAAAFDRFVDDYEGEYDDVEIETSPDYALGE